MPLRFLLKTAHFITLLAIAFDIDGVTSGMTGVYPPNASDSQLSDFYDTRKV